MRRCTSISQSVSRKVSPPKKKWKELLIIIVFFVLKKELEKERYKPVIRDAYKAIENKKDEQLNTLHLKS